MVLTDSKWKIGNLIGNDKNMTNLAISATQFETYFIDVYYCTLQECKVLFFTLIHIELQYDRQCSNYKSMTCTRTTAEYVQDRVGTGRGARGARKMVV